MSSNCVLPDDIVRIIQDIVLNIKQEFSCDDMIKDGIFDLLEKKCTVIYYPLPDEKNRGFHIKRAVNDKLEDFVYINTDKTVEQQVFTAAHELGHLFDVYGKVVKKAGSKGIVLDKNDREYEENVTDRFAAEFIMPESSFIAATRSYAREFGINNTVSVFDMLKLIAKLMEDFLSPFNAVRKRLHEIGAIDDNSNSYMSLNKEKLEAYIDSLKNDNNSLINSKTGVKTISGLRDFVEMATENPNTDKVLIAKIREDFDLEDIQLNDQIMFSGENLE